MALDSLITQVIYASAVVVVAFIVRASARLGASIISHRGALWGGWMMGIVVVEFLTGPWRQTQPLGAVTLWGPALLCWTALAAGISLRHGSTRSPFVAHLALYAALTLWSTTHLARAPSWIVDGLSPEQTFLLYESLSDHVLLWLADGLGVESTASMRVVEVLSLWVTSMLAYSEFILATICHLISWTLLVWLHPAQKGEVGPGLEVWPQWRWVRGIFPVTVFLWSITWVGAQAPSARLFWLEAMGFAGAPYLIEGFRILQARTGRKALITVSLILLVGLIPGLLMWLIALGVLQHILGINLMPTHRSASSPTTSRQVLRWFVVGCGAWSLGGLATLALTQGGLQVGSDVAYAERTSCQSSHQASGASDRIAFTDLGFEIERVERSLSSAQRGLRTEAQSSCAADGMRLCGLDEWQAACECGASFSPPRPESLNGALCGVGQKDGWRSARCVDASNVENLLAGRMELVETASIGTLTFMGPSPSATQGSSSCVALTYLSADVAKQRRWPWLGYRCCRDLP